MLVLAACLRTTAPQSVARVQLGGGILDLFWGYFVQCELSSPTIVALERLAALFGLSLIEKQAGDFLEDGYLSGKAVRKWTIDARHCIPGRFPQLTAQTVGMMAGC